MGQQWWHSCRYVSVTPCTTVHRNGIQGYMCSKLLCIQFKVIWILFTCVCMELCVCVWICVCEYVGVCVCVKAHMMNSWAYCTSLLGCLLVCQLLLFCQITSLVWLTQKIPQPHIIIFPGCTQLCHELLWPLPEIIRFQKYISMLKSIRQFQLVYFINNFPNKCLTDILTKILR